MGIIGGSSRAVVSAEYDADNPDRQVVQDALDRDGDSGPVGQLAAVVVATHDSRGVGGAGHPTGILARLSRAVPTDDVRSDVGGTRSWSPVRGCPGSTPRR
jgi:hypothetical protein